MVGPLENLADVSSADKAVTVLAVSPHREDHACLCGIFSQSNWKIFGARDCCEAMHLLRRSRISVVVCECKLPDGDWKKLLRSLPALDWPPLLVVTSRNASPGLWAEVLNVGAYDVLTKPFDRAEVTRIISLAWLHWKEEFARHIKRPARMAASSIPVGFCASA